MAGNLAAMPKVAIVAKITAKPQRFDELVALAESMAEQSGSEPGTEVYTMNITTGDDRAIWFYEIYADDEAFKAHSTSDAMARFGSSLQEIAEPDIELHVLTPHAIKGLALDLA